MMTTDGNVDRQLLALYNQNCISKTDQEYLYRCELCRIKFKEYVLSSHISEDRKHRNKRTSFKEDITIFSLPEPCKAQLRAIDGMVERYSGRLLTEKQKDLRMAAVREIEATINVWFPGTRIYLRPYGSIVSGFALDNSDVNVELVLENEDKYNSAQILQNVAMKMSLDMEVYTEIQKEFDISSPRFSFRYSSHFLGQEKPKIHFGVYSSSSLEVAELLAKYESFDPRVAKLAACFKLWARNCGFDRADHGFWPSHSFHIMVIHFLQQTSPPVLPSLFPLDGSTPSKEAIEEKYSVLRSNWPSRNKQTLGQLWLQLLAYYAKDFNRDNVVNIRGLELTLSSKNWTTCILAVEDPVHHSHNLSRSIGRKELYYNYQHNLLRTYRYFMIPRTAERCLINLDDFSQELRSPCFRTLMASEDSDDDETKDKGSDEEFDADESRGETKASKKELNFTYNIKLAKKFGISYRLKDEISVRWASLTHEHFWYTLEFHLNPCFKLPQKYCIKCKRIDHFKKDCPAEKLPDLIPVPSTLFPEQSARLDEVCSRLYYSERLDDNYEQVHESILESLTSLVREIYPDANLQLFGSSKNGFGAKKCDLDICLTFRDNEDGRGIDQTEVIKKLADEFKKHGQRISNLQPIPQAKVPVLKLRFKSNRKIVKGRSTPEHFDCDISLYNLLASHNTRLLRTYCQVDDRVAMLGFTVKQFFKKCGICDASKGSLSSYAYTLMTLYYLQRCSPPVIPILQELYDGDSPPERTVDGYNTWFFDDIDSLAQRWTHYNSNKLTVGNLFYGFLKFYAEIFPFEALVVCIRRSQDLTKMEKKWTGRRIAIEDPFLLSHNLGQGIESEMARYIKASIILGRNRLGNQPDNFDGYNSWTDYFFDARYLNDGPFPRGRGCHYCSRIGHQKNNCPERIRAQVLNRIKQACDKRPENLRKINVRLVAVSKTKPKQLIIDAYGYGQRHFGENYVNELSEKSHDQELLNKCPDIQWHFIGRVQKKQINKLLGSKNLSIWETIDSQLIADLANSSLKRNFPGKRVKIMVQVNTSGEENKGGVEPEKVVDLVNHIRTNCQSLELVGLMTIGSYDNSQSDDLNPDFEQLVKCKHEVCSKFDYDPDEFELSMGMSSDFETAILMGSSNVRVGSTIFGRREYKK
ncbi:terminal uridylyltransferase 7-like isoform X2 [Panonychus citri]|uniref:terminal uridylyltransferase 7-like isoform X2 n=1 Tax=Panonychus citri TaxID=50023 RepID=UPI002307AD64|nr:terminal uridylyltransferase 7-like isoform X2 [Panonychus citri]XP_053207032.1 terminal uridylyltransferase 7-like isoform X2 [Panonychus citri]